MTPEEARGAIDERAGVRFAAGALRASYNDGTRRVSLRGDVLAEERASGTAPTRNSAGSGCAGGCIEPRENARFFASAFPP